MRARIAAIAVATAGCYAPAPPEGAPCSAEGACPSGLRCDPALGRCVRALIPIDAEPDAAADGPPGPFDAPSTELVDDFARPDSPALGNGWIEKHPPTFAIASGEVVRIDTDPVSYRDNLVYRPAVEDLRDVEISVRVHILAFPPRYPQLFVRARSASIAAPDSYDGYLLYVNGTTTDQVVLGRQLGGVFVATLSTITLSPALTAGGSYRLTLRAQGASPVALAATVEQLANGAWTEIGATSVVDAAPERIDSAGTVGFAGDEFGAYVYDDFHRRAL